jgi:hypothetical protein
MQHLEPPIETHNQLNPLLWKGDQLRSPVRRALLNTAEHFLEFLDVNAKPIDIVIAGSQVNYNYTRHSDIDLHLIFDFDQIECDEPIEELFNAKRQLWKTQHTVKIHGFEVEPYAEDNNRPAVSAYYSLIKNQWIKRPQLQKIEYDRQLVKQGAVKWNQLIDFAIQQKNLKIARDVKKLLFAYRRTGLAAHGEFGTPNLIFKSLRNSKQIERLIKTVNQLEDHKLSVD